MSGNHHIRFPADGLHPRVTTDCSLSSLLERRNPLGLLWGNFPQTHGMAGVIGSALRLSRSWEEIV